MIHTVLNDKKVVLASASPRRRFIFKQLGINVLHKPANIDENSDISTPRKFVLHMSKMKGHAVAKEMDAECIIVAADTVVYLDKIILNKPEDRFQAADYLTLLSGKTHYVYTGVCVCYRRNCITDYEKTAVTFADLTAQEVSEYLDTSEPDDKAGAYGIQGYGSQFIKKVNGCYFNVMGFPVFRFYQMLKELLG